MTPARRQAEGGNPALGRMLATRHGTLARHRLMEWVVVEAPLEIWINGCPYTITMRTPGHDRFLTRGLLFCEGILTNGAIPLRRRSRNGGKGAAILDVTIPKEQIRSESIGSRSIVSFSSCGLCGKQSLEASRIGAAGGALRPSCRLERSLIPAMMAQMETSQKVFRASGGAHAAAAFTIQGKMLAAFEDIGRHNAVDKTIGALLERGTLAQAECLCVSGRVSYEIVDKAYWAGIPYLIACSAPSSLAVELAKKRGITLVGFCREGRFTAYSNSSRFNAARRSKNVEKP